MKRFLFIFSIVFTLTGLTFVPGRVYAATPIKILLVPGHDDTTWGAQYGNTKEAGMNLALATRIFNSLKKDKRFEVYITRDLNGYTKEFSDYFANNKDEIVSFRNTHKAAHKQKVGEGNFIEKETVIHNAADERMSVILYGINKWANEHSIDAVMHIHFNDHVRKTVWAEGIHKGFAVYVPEGQMINSKTSTELGKKIFTQLRKKYRVSTYEKEKEGIVFDQKLIALGSNGTLNKDVRSVLVEYGYIYRFKTKKFRESAYAAMSSYTVSGIKNYFLKK